MNKKLLVLLLFIPFALWIPAYAQSNNPTLPAPLILTNRQGEYDLGPIMEILEDPSGKLTINQVSSLAFTDRFTPSTTEAPNFGYTNSAYWVRFKVRNEAREINRWLVEVGFANMHYVDLYYPASNGSQDFVHKELGVMRPVRERNLAYQRMVFYVPLDYQQDRVVYMRFQNGASMSLPLTLWSSDHFIDYRFTEALLLGIFYGALLIMMFYNIFLFASLKDLNYLYFTLLLASAIIFFASYDGLLELYLWPSINVWKKYTIAWSVDASMIFILLFASSFLDLRRKLPQAQKIINALIFIWLAQIPLAFFLSYQMVADLFTLIGVITLGVVIAISSLLLIKGIYRSLYFVLSWLGFFLGYITLLLVRFGVITSSLITEQALRIGLLWLAAFWAFALAERINRLKEETETANRELQKSQQQLTQTLDGLPIGVVVYGLDLKPRYGNPRLIEILSNPERGIVPDLSAGRTITDAIKYYSLTGPENSKEEQLLGNFPIWQAFQGKKAWADDITANLIDRQVSLEIWASPVKDALGRVKSVVAVFEDITKRKMDSAELLEYRQNLERLVVERTAQLEVSNEQLQAEAAERKRLQEELLLRMEWLVTFNFYNQKVTRTTELPEIYQNFTQVVLNLFSSSAVFIAKIDPDLHQLVIYGYITQEDTSQDWTKTILPLPVDLLSNPRFANGDPVIFTRDQLSQLTDRINAYLETTEGQFFVLAPMLSNQRLVGLLGLVYVEYERQFSDGDMALLVKICSDIVQLEQNALQFDQTRDQVAAEERNRLARDLHDSVTQVLYAANIIAELLPKRLRRDPEGALQSAAELRRLMRGALAEMRTLLLELRPAGITNIPLGELLTQLTEAVSIQSELAFQLYVDNLPRLPADIQTAFYRIAQEALNNVVKHAQAGQVILILYATPSFDSPEIDSWVGELKMVVKDDGIGFNIADGNLENFGLGIMRERAAAIDGVFTIESQPGCGTVVTLIWRKMEGK